MISHDLFAALSLIYLFCEVDTGVCVFLSVVFVVSFLCVLRPQYCNSFHVNWLPCSLTPKLFSEANTPFLFHCTFYVISSLVLCRGRIK